MTDKLPDVWAARDFPVLKAATEAVDGGGYARIPALVEKTGLDEGTVSLALAALERRGLVEVQRSLAGPRGVGNVSGEAYLLTGLHPDGNDALEALASMFRQAADKTTDPDEKTRLRRAASAVGDVIGNVGAGVLTAFLAHQGGFG